MSSVVSLGRARGGAALELDGRGRADCEATPTEEPPGSAASEVFSFAHTNSRSEEAGDDATCPAPWLGGPLPPRGRFVVSLHGQLREPSPSFEPPAAEPAWPEATQTEFAHAEIVGDATPRGNGERACHEFV